MISRIKPVSAGESGFTLIEMMVVIAVLGIILGMLAQYGPPRDRWAQTRGAAAQVAAVMVDDRDQAIRSGAAVKLVLPPLPGGTAASIAAPAGGIVFEPDGSDTGGQVVLDGGRRLVVSADWLTGRISIHAP